jgi:DNA polymerase-3 subunit delta
MVDAAITGRSAQAIREIRLLLQEGEPPVRLNFMLARQVRIMLQAGELVRQGNSPESLARTLGEHPFTIKKALAQGKALAHEQMAEALGLLLQLDQELKSSPAPQGILMELALLRLTRVLSRGNTDQGRREA